MKKLVLLFLIFFPLMGYCQTDGHNYVWESLAKDWDKILSLTFSVVAIAIAIISSRQTSRDARKQLEGLEKLTVSNVENADRQIESIKNMTVEATDGVKKQMIGVRHLCITILELYIVSLEDEIYKMLHNMDSPTEDFENQLKKMDEIKESADKDKGYYPFISNQSETDRLASFQKRKLDALIHVVEELKRIKSNILSDAVRAKEEAKKNGTYKALYYPESLY